MKTEQQSMERKKILLNLNAKPKVIGWWLGFLMNIVQNFPVVFFGSFCFFFSSCLKAA
jgi:hypothetical protein